jgi:hypothetical protein
MDRSSRVELKKKYIDDQVGWNAKLNIYIYIYIYIYIVFVEIFLVYMMN